MKHSKEYIRVMRSKRWDDFSRYATHMASNKCQRCKERSTGLVAHHLHYRSLGREQLRDVEVVCDVCHPPADREREMRTAIEAMERQFDAGLHTYMTKKYGSGYYAHPDNRREFHEWRESQASGRWR